MFRSPSRATAGALAGLLALGLVGAASAPAVAADTSFSLTGEPIHWYTGEFTADASIAPDTDQIELVLPAELTSFVGEEWYVELFSDGFISNPAAVVAGGVATITGLDGVFAPEGGGYLYLSSEIADTGGYMQVTVYFSVNSNIGPSLVEWGSTNLTADFVTQDEYWVLDGTTPLVVAPGDTVTVDAPAGYFTTGMNGTWNFPAGVESFAQLGNDAAVVSAPSSLDPDGSSVTVTVPRSHWAWPASGEVFLDLYSYSTDSDTRSELVYVSLAVTFDDVAAPVVDRISGADRFVVSQSIARESFPTGASTVYITNGLNYPDALSASPAAAFLGGPLLLTLPTAMPDGLEDTIRDLAPDTIVVVGGPNSVSAGVYDQLASIVGTSNITRLGGADRFAASRNLTRDTFEGPGAPTVYLATGLNFPDALSASAAAGAIGAPVVLVNGGAPTLDAETLQLLSDLGTQTVFVAGGPNSVSPGIITSLSNAGYFTERLSGADRFEASSNIARLGFPQAERVFLATGFNFPDALSGASWAARTQSPLIVIPGTCIPQRVLRDLANYQVTEVTILGGPNSVSVAVESLTACAGFDWPDGGSTPKLAPIGAVAGPTVDRVNVDQLRQRVEAQR